MPAGDYVGVRVALRAEQWGADDFDDSRGLRDPLEPLQQVTVIDGIPCFVDGLVRALQDAGFGVTHPESAALDPAAVVYITSATTEAEWERVRSLATSSKVLLLSSATGDDDALRALRAGARGVIARSSPLADLVGAVRAVTHGLTVIPPEVARQLVSLVSDPQAHTELSSAEQRWLEALADGRTVTQIANESGYSRRAMHGKLDLLYSKMGVANHEQALVKAAHWGLL